MLKSALTFRSIAVAATLVVGASAHALTIPTNALVANSVQAFSVEANDAFVAGGVTVTPLGNATALVVPVDAPPAYNLPITTITVGSKLNIAAGDAKGSALQITRLAKGFGTVGLVLANFTLNYDTKQVMADTTTLGGETVKQLPTYNFNVATPLGIKYKFPLSITAHEVLDKLTLTPEARLAMIKALKLSVSLVAALDSVTTFGTLTQDIVVKLRPKAVSATPYTPAP
ncbi:MAG: hypothetical protein Q7U28_16485 [Aquabacterium sp.]|nr:hypothetical protein [Aquabacterium sp.]